MDPRVLVFAELCKTEPFVPDFGLDADRGFALQPATRDGTFKSCRIPEWATELLRTVEEHEPAIPPGEPRGTSQPFTNDVGKLWDQGVAVGCSEFGECLATYVAMSLSWFTETELDQQQAYSESDKAEFIRRTEYAWKGTGTREM